ncbi:MAG: chloramphenicol acetyltransferase [Bacteroidales bacterium]|nr:chloramphenicol acetyltransferase [Bacteroidales bacterium]
MSSSNRSNVHIIVHVQFPFRNGYYTNFAADLIWTNNKVKTEIQPEESSRAEAFRLWMSSPMPMVTLVKTMDVSRLVKVSRKSGIKFTTLMCWCIGKAASQVEEFYTLPEGGRLFRYDRLAINVIVQNSKGGINSCDIPFTDDLQQFNRDYLDMTATVANECKSTFLEDHMVIGTSAMIQTELDCIVNQYTDQFCNPMVMWGKYRKSLFRNTLPISFQFHHVQMDGGQGAIFLDELQRKIITASSPQPPTAPIRLCCR